MHVKYSCVLCGLHRATVEVREPHKDETPFEWMASVTATLARDHEQRSPTCTSRELSEVLIPLDETTGQVGDPKS